MSAQRFSHLSRVSFSQHQQPFISSRTETQVREQVTCVLCGGVGQVESTATVVGPTHELDSDLVAG